jgi:hypothetical protein
MVTGDDDLKVIAACSSGVTSNNEAVNTSMTPTKFILLSKASNLLSMASEDIENLGK